MKKIVLGILQFISYIVIYEIVVWVVYLLASLLQMLLYKVPVLQAIIPDIAMEGIVFTLCPIICGISVVYLMGLLFKKNGLYIASTIPMLMLLSYTNISNIVNAGIDYGVISWPFANVVWQSIIICGIIIVGLLGLAGYDFLKRAEKETNLQ